MYISISIQYPISHMEFYPWGFPPHPTPPHASPPPAPPAAAPAWGGLGGNPFWVYCTMDTGYWLCLYIYIYIYIYTYICYLFTCIFVFLPKT